MIFTGKNLKRLREIVQRAQNDVHNDIGGHAAPHAYEEEVEELEQEGTELDKLFARIDRAIEKEDKRENT